MVITKIMMMKAISTPVYLASAVFFTFSEALMVETFVLHGRRQTIKAYNMNNILVTSGNQWCTIIQFIVEYRIKGGWLF